MEVDPPGVSYYRAELAFHVIQRVGVGRLRFRRDAISGNDKLEVAHVGIICGVEHTEIRGESCQDQHPRSQMLEQEIEAGGEEAGVLWLHDKVVLLSGEEKAGDRGSRQAVLQAVSHLLSEVGAPSAKIIVHIDDGYTRSGGALLERLNTACSRLCIAQQLVRLREVQIVDNVNEE